MEKLSAAAFRAIGSVFVPGMLGVFVASTLLTLGALTLFIFGTTGVSAYVSTLVSNPSLATWLPWASGVGAVMLAWFLFPGIMALIVNFFDQRIARLIEEKDYPAAQPIEPRFWPEFWHDLRFSLSALVLNILILPVYLIPVLGQVAFYMLNGHLLGKEFFVMVARRHKPLPEALALRRAHSRTIFIGGIFLTVLATIPMINLVAPFWGIALMTHLYHSLVRTPKMDVLPPN